MHITNLTEGEIVIAFKIAGDIYAQKAKIKGFEKLIKSAQVSLKKSLAHKKP